MSTLRLFVSGRVQGVGYRAWTVREARRLGLRGFVRNLPDGRVEILAGGAGAERLAALCRQGPRGAHVTGIEIRSVEDTLPEDFAERPTLSASG